MSKKFIPIYDLSNLTEEQKQEYVGAVCDHLEVPKELNLVRLIWSDEGDGARRQVAYVLKGATDIIREKRKITTESLTSQIVQGSVVFTATGKDKEGRQEIAVGSAFIGNAIGKNLDNAIMTAQTRATRRMTIQFVGGGVLDESEVNSFTTNIASQSIPLAQLSLAPAPSVMPSSEPGKDITEIRNADSKSIHVDGVEIKPGEATILTPGQIFRQDPDHDMEECVKSNVPCGNIVHDIGKFTVVNIDNPQKFKNQEEFEAHQRKLREDAISKLNAGTTPQGPPAKKPRKPRGPNKPKVNLGPSDNPPKPDIKPDAPAVIVPPTPVLVPVSEQMKPDIKSDIPAAPTKPRLTREQVKPFTQRLFKIVNDQLEPNGFAPKEGMGNGDKMRAFANVMFPDVTNMNELTLEQWEKYLTTLENKINTTGSAATIKYIEDSIGI